MVHETSGGPNSTQGTSVSGTPSPGTGEVVLLWDFFGPRGEGTARHFRAHLEEFLERESVGGCSVGVSSTDPRHWAAWCLAPIALDELLTAALKPRRREVGEQSLGLGH